jgi:hypothetical protein
LLSQHLDDGSEVTTPVCVGFGREPGLPCGGDRLGRQCRWEGRGEPEPVPEIAGPAYQGWTIQVERCDVCSSYRSRLRPPEKE